MSITPISYKSATPINLTAAKDRLSRWTAELIFSSQEALKNHFLNHKDDRHMQNLNLKNKNSYLSAAQNNIIQAIFGNGSVIRNRDGTRVIFLYSIPGTSWSERITAVSLKGSQPVINTFHAGRDVSMSGIVNHLGFDSFIAFFSNGVSEKGWQKLAFGEPWNSGSPVQPEKPLARGIDFTRTENDYYK